MKTTYRNHDMEDYIDYHDIRYILYITTKLAVFDHQPECTEMLHHNFMQCICIKHMSIDTLRTTYLCIL